MKLQDRQDLGTMIRRIRYQGGATPDEIRAVVDDALGQPAAGGATVSAREVSGLSAEARETLLAMGVDPARAALAGASRDLADFKRRLAVAGGAR